MRPRCAAAHGCDTNGECDEDFAFLAPVLGFDGPDESYPDAWVARDAVATLRTAGLIGGFLLFQTGIALFSGANEALAYDSLNDPDGMVIRPGRGEFAKAAKATMVKSTTVWRNLP